MWIWGYALGIDGVDVIKGIEPVILGGYVDVVHVEKNAAVSGVDDFVEELPFGHFRLVKLGVAADVFYGNGNLEKILNLADACSRSLDGFECVGKGQEVVSIATVDAAPAEVVGEPRGFGAAG